MLPWAPVWPLEAPRPPARDIYTPTQAERRVFVTYHVAFIAEAPWLRPVAMRDWQKVSQILKGAWPKPLPMMLSYPPPRWPLKCSWDTEFNDDFMFRYSMAWDSPSGPLVHVVERADSYGNPPKVESGSVIIMQNAEADLSFMEQILGKVDVRVEDTMYAHSVLWSDLDHDLNFGGSLYASINRWKHLVTSNPRVYSAGDAVGTLDWWKGMEAEFQRDPRSQWVYQHCLLPQLQVIRKARAKGIKVNHARIGPAFKELEHVMTVERLKAQAWAGYPINLDSPPQVARWLYDIEDIGARKKGR